MHNLKYIFASIVLIIILNGQYLAQGCVQCKAQIESSEENGLSVGNGLNYGITLLMITPYILLLSIPLFIYRKRFFGFLKDFGNMWRTKPNK